MSNVNIVAKVIAYGVPALLILLGFIAWLGGEMLSGIGVSNGASSTGLAMIAIGVVLYGIKIFLR